MTTGQIILENLENLLSPTSMVANINGGFWDGVQLGIQAGTTAGTIFLF